MVWDYFDSLRPEKRENPERNAHPSICDLNCTWGSDPKDPMEMLWLTLVINA